MMVEICGAVIVFWLASVIWLVVALHRAPHGKEVPGVGFINLEGKTKHTFKKDRKYRSLPAITSTGERYENNP